MTDIDPDLSPLPKNPKAGPKLTSLSSPKYMGKPSKRSCLPDITAFEER